MHCLFVFGFGFFVTPSIYHFSCEPESNQRSSDGCQVQDIHLNLFATVTRFATHSFGYVRGGQGAMALGLGDPS